MDRLFVYGIFLGEGARKKYGMSNPVYSTVKNYITVGHGIVTAVKTNKPGVELTGLVVDVDPEYWPKIDELEQGYDRIIVKTCFDEEVYMYANPV